MIKTFEQYNENKYAVVAVGDGSTFVNCYFSRPGNPVYKTMFKRINDIGDNTVQEYTLEEAERYIEYLKRNYGGGKIENTFEAIPIEEIQLLIKSNDYNI